MTGEVFIPSAVNDKDLDQLLERVSFPLTKAEIIHNAELKGVSPSLLGLFRKLPSRFYRSKDELISQCVVRSVHYSEIGFDIRLDCQTKT
ncbi:DUF2795 domain-containing protein [Dehalococcoides mccartyi]|uniref:DUF2795 domain-containing protein n=1 Tax=Dehalococcoides mccartyi TaxID=61435 RepID=A0A142V8N2_9CHLR|nr:DUF2795 domain-containing protein [Dehalococcoides mccartyi]AMU86009.1 hypothetical protein Dm11a5_0178 [Dehalococcoides mccartyi]